MAGHMRIAVDAMGADDAPRTPVAGAVEAVAGDGTDVILVGDRERVERELDSLGVSAELRRRLEVVHAEEVVGMEESAITPMRRKRRSSIRICAELVKEGRAQALVSAGNTGATMISAKMVIGVAKGVDRPGLAAALPNASGWTVLVDVGANVDSKAEQMREFAVMGHFYAQEMLGIAQPRIGLLSIGSEEGKGTDFTRRAYAGVQSTGLRFIGNVEGRDLFNGATDVIVCDGFVGNVLLKSAESLAEMVVGMLRAEIKKSPLSMLGALLMVPAFRHLRRRTDYSEYGAAPLLGLRGGCFIAHGGSNPKAIKNAVRRAVEFCEAGIHEKISNKLADLHATPIPSSIQEPEVQTS
jgi:glycerol-3-phosphate acyltransferase PlsX